MTTTDVPTTETGSDTADLDLDELQAFLGRFVGDLGAALHAPLIVLGDRLGLYKALAEGPATAERLATRTGCNTRYLREWLAANAASGYVTVDGGTGQFSLSPVQVATLADESSPAFIPGAFLIALAVARDLDGLELAFQTGAGIGWHDHDHALFHGTERFFRPGYVANLSSSWLPALDGVVDRLTAGASVADLGCGHGASTILMAQQFPSSTFVGFDYHEESIAVARQRAAEAGLGDRIAFEVASAASYPGSGYDLVTVFDALHDMGDPVGAARHVLASLAADGTWMIVEPFANDELADNLNPVGRVFYSASTSLCTPASRAQEVGLALGAQAGEGRLREVVTAAGFTRFRRATETPFNLVLEARP